MPCYLFTYRAYGSWMPDREQGFVRRGQGVLPPDEELARQYHNASKQRSVIFDDQTQRLIVDELQTPVLTKSAAGITWPPKRLTCTYW